MEHEILYPYPETLLPRVGQKQPFPSQFSSTCLSLGGISHLCFRVAHRNSGSQVVWSCLYPAFVEQVVHCAAQESGKGQKAKGSLLKSMLCTGRRVLVGPWTPGERMRRECGISFLYWQRQYSPRNVAHLETGRPVILYLICQYTSIHKSRKRE